MKKKVFAHKFIIIHLVQFLIRQIHVHKSTGYLSLIYTNVIPEHTLPFTTIHETPVLISLASLTDEWAR